MGTVIRVLVTALLRWQAQERDDAEGERMRTVLTVADWAGIDGLLF